MSVSLRQALTEKRIEASAPCRIDSGGTWDIKTMALPLEGIRPVTVNIALNLRTRVTLLPFDDGRVRISSRGFGRKEHSDLARLPFHTPYGLFFAAVSYFGFHGLDVHILADAPGKSALGGSSTALIA
ncbi:MAG: galactokinase, partial [Deltaproteobacteria bacterium]|nr:galactokinase [Deltaproteobacteria bacterium]